MSASLHEFLASPERNKWCLEGPIEVYARKSRRVLPPRPGLGELKQVLDLATVTTEKPGTGALPALLDQAEALARDFGYEAIYVENVLNERLRPWLEKRGFIKLYNHHDPGDASPCYWKPV